MKIEKITLCNITAYEGEHTIDFTAEPLRSAGLFAITGPTGAGKTSLLDAICLALYGNAPRFDNIRGRGSLKQLRARAEADGSVPIGTDDARNMMRRDQKSAYCRVAFAMPDGSRYEAAWLCRIKRTGTYDAVSRELLQLAPRRKTLAEGSGARVQPAIDAVVGLDYKQFSRTVMLAQGSFSAFLKAENEEKSALLEKLTGTEIYGIVSKRIFERSRAATAKADNLQSLIDGILTGTLSPEALADIESDLHQKETLAKNLQASIDTARRRTQWLDSFEQCSAELQGLEQANIAARHALDEMRNRQLELERYDAILPQQSLFRDIIFHRASIESLKSQADAATTRLTEMRKELARASAELDTAREQTAEAEAGLRNRQPTINYGNKLVGEIGQAQLQVERLATQERQAQSVLEERGKRMQHKQQEIEALAKSVADLQLHMQSLSVHRVMFERIELIRDKLASFRNETTQNTQDRTQLVNLQQTLSGLNDACQKLESRIIGDEGKLNTVKGELLVHRQVITGQDSAELHSRMADNHSRALALGNALSLWRKLSDGYDELAERRAKLARDAAGIEQLRKDIERAAYEEKVRREAYENLNEACLLSNSENIRRLRRHLREGTACPVCGSAHHPYHTETEQELGEVLSRLEQDHREAEEHWQQKSALLGQLRLRLAAEEGELKSDRATLESLATRQQALEAEWQEYAGLADSFDKCSPSVNRDARRATIVMLLDSARLAADEARKELDVYNYHQSLINSYATEAEKLSARIAANRSALNEMRTNIKVNQSKADTTQQRITRSDRACEQLYRDLDETISLSDWFAEWKRSPDNLRLRLGDMCQDWRGTQHALEDQTHSLAIRREELHTLEENLAEANRQLTAARDEHDNAQKVLQAKRDELRSLFGNLTPEQEEAQLQAYVGKMQQAQQVRREAYDRTNRAATELQGRFESLEESRRAVQDQCARLMSQLDLWIQRFNADNPPLQFSEMERVFTDPRDWNALRAELDGKKNRLALVEQQLGTVRVRYVDLLSDPLRADVADAAAVAAARSALADEAGKLQTQLTETEEALSRLRMQIFAHQDSLEKARAQQPALDAARADALEWQRLNALLGSADGKKFRELAQRFTFCYLVDHANVQLRQLTPRYELRVVPGSLLLEVVDRDLFDRRRYVSSLSGGESFVVSLALSLGLATLSAGRLAIGSLFIDEGFGNLDHDSLDLVMQALARLEDSQGRKVGIVSHTDQIRSQISPQIQVSRLPGGAKSEVRIV